nr:MAG TPA: minor tail protein [Bacteriophage sp.]
MAKKTQAQIEFKAVTSEFTSGIKEVNSSLKTMQNELKLNSAQLKNNGEDADLLTQRQQVLQRQYDATSQKIELTEKSLEEAKRVLGENSTEYRNLENALLRAKTAQQNIQTEINQTSRRLEDLESSANNAEDDIESLSRELNDLGDSANSTEGGFTTLKGAIANFAGNVLSNITSKIGELVGKLFELNEETKEFRMNMAKLDGASQQYGYSQEFTNQKIKEMYGYFQDDQVAVNAISNLEGLKLSEDELSSALSAGVAVWTAYGDSIPIESLTESINESAQVAKVTGSLADALNWAGISEDDFNLKLEKCNSTKERAQLITDTLNGAYGKSKQTYDENTESLRENNEANMELIQAQAELGEAIEPVDTALTNLKAGALQAITPAILTVSNGIGGLVTAFQSLPQPVQTTILVIAAISLAIVGLIGSVGIISSVWGVLTGIFSAGIAVFAGVGGAIAAISTPVLIAVAVISTLIAIGITLYKNWDIVKAKASSIWNGIKSVISNVTSSISSTVTSKFNTIKSTATNSWNAIKNTTNTVWNGIKTTASSGLDWIKNKLFNFKPSWSIPKPKLPKVDIGIGHKTILGASVPYPTFSISWHKLGGIFKKPTLFNTGSSIHGVGEAGAEAVLPLNGFYDYLDRKLNTINSTTETIDYDRLTKSVVSGLKEVGIYMDSKPVGRLVAKEVYNVNSANQSRLNRLAGVR